MGPLFRRAAARSLTHVNREEAPARRGVRESSRSPEDACGDGRRPPQARSGARETGPRRGVRVALGAEALLPSIGQPFIAHRYPCPGIVDLRVMLVAVCGRPSIRSLLSPPGDLFQLSPTTSGKA